MIDENDEGNASETASIINAKYSDYLKLLSKRKGVKNEDYDITICGSDNEKYMKSRSRILKKLNFSRKGKLIHNSDKIIAKIRIGDQRADFRSTFYLSNQISSEIKTIDQKDSSDGSKTNKLLKTEGKSQSLNRYSKKFIQWRATINFRTSTKQTTRNNKGSTNYGYLEDDEEYWNGVPDRVKDFRKPTFNISVRPKRNNNISPKVSNNEENKTVNHRHLEIESFLKSSLIQKEENEIPNARSKSTMTKLGYRSRKRLNNPTLQDCDQFRFESNNCNINNRSQFGSDLQKSIITKADSLKRFDESTFNLQSENDYSIFSKEKIKINNTSLNFYTKCNIRDLKQSAKLQPLSFSIDSSAFKKNNLRMVRNKFIYLDIIAQFLILSCTSANESSNVFKKSA